MDYLRRIQRGIDFVEANLDSSFELAEVAQHAGMSQWHFQRIFKAITQETLKFYVRARRLSNSLNKLHGTDKRILDIAVEAGFESQEAFTRAFKKAYQMTPGEYRRFGQHKQFAKKLEISRDYLEHIKQGVELQPEIIVQSEKTLIGMRTCFHSVDSEKKQYFRKAASFVGKIYAALRGN